LDFIDGKLDASCVRRTATYIYHGIHDRSSHRNVKHHIHVIFDLLDVSHRTLENFCHSTFRFNSSKELYVENHFQQYVDIRATI